MKLVSKREFRDLLSKELNKYSDYLRVVDEEKINWLVERVKIELKESYIIDPSL